jgi:hypothetical protein
MTMTRVTVEGVDFSRAQFLATPWRLFLRLKSLTVYPFSQFVAVLRTMDRPVSATLERQEVAFVIVFK